MSVTIAPTEALTAASLKTEIQSGPYASLFSADVTATNWPAIAALLNDETNAQMQGPVLAPPISGADLLAAIHAPDMNNISSTQNDLLKDYLDADSVNVSDAGFQSFITGIFTQAQSPTTYNKLTGVGFAYKIGSRAEVLFGTGTTIGGNDVQFAMTGSAPQPHIS